MADAESDAPLNAEELAKLQQYNQQADQSSMTLNVTPSSASPAASDAPLTPDELQKLRRYNEQADSNEGLGLNPPAREGLPLSSTGVVDKYADTPDLMWIPELRKHMNSLDAIAGLLSSNADSVESIMKKQFPKATVTRDPEDGTVLVKSGDDKKTYAFKPGRMQLGDWVRAGISAPPMAVGAGLAGELAPAWAAGTAGIGLGTYILGQLRKDAGGAPPTAGEIAGGMAIGGGAHLLGKGLQAAGTRLFGELPLPPLADDMVSAARGDADAAGAVASQVRPKQGVVDAANRLSGADGQTGILSQLTPAQLSDNPEYRQLSQAVQGADATHASSYRTVGRSLDRILSSGGGPEAMDAVEALRDRIKTHVESSGAGVDASYKAVGVPKGAPTPVANLIAKIDEIAVNNPGKAMPEALKKIRARLGASAAQSTYALPEELEHQVEHIAPEDIEPPHEVKDSAKLQKITDGMKADPDGWVGRPLVVVKYGSGNQASYQAITGSHRIAAAREVMNRVPAVVLTEAQAAAIPNIGHMNEEYVEGVLRDAGYKDVADLINQDLSSGGAGSGHPTWDTVDMLMKDLGAARKGKGIYKSLTASGIAEDLVKAGKMDQQLAANEFSTGAGERFTAAQEAFKAHRDLKSAYVSTLGKLGKDSLAAQIGPATKMLGYGVPEAFDTIMNMTPKADRATVAKASLFQFLRDDGAIDAPKFVKWYRGLQRNALSRDALKANIGDEMMGKLRDVYEVTNAIKTASESAGPQFASAFVDQPTPLPTLAKNLFKVGLANLTARPLNAIGVPVSNDILSWVALDKVFGPRTALKDAMQEFLTSPAGREALKRSASGAATPDFIRSISSAFSARKLSSAFRVPMSQNQVWWQNLFAAGAVGSPLRAGAPWNQPQEANQ